MSRNYIRKPKKDTKKESAKARIHKELEKYSAQEKIENTPFHFSGFKPRTINQNKFVITIKENDITFGIGSAGSGKSYVSCAVALQMLSDGEVKKIVITRPAVEAGENLGFLPGDVSMKVHQYILPIYDAIDEMIGKLRRESMVKDGTLEVAPLAYLRGRSLNDCVIIADESQNITSNQLLMLLTRLGKKSKIILNGDPSQTDLPSKSCSGLMDAVNRLEHVRGVGVVQFGIEDVVRHRLVMEVIKAYQN
jgi:phosphate starvation-inducible PhoH-like protein